MKKRTKTGGQPDTAANQKIVSLEERRQAREQMQDDQTREALSDGMMAKNGFGEQDETAQGEEVCDAAAQDRAAQGEENCDAAAQDQAAQSEEICDEAAQDEPAQESTSQNEVSQNAVSRDTASQNEVPQDDPDRDNADSFVQDAEDSVLNGNEQPDEADRTQNETDAADAGIEETHSPDVQVVEVDILDAQSRGSRRTDRQLDGEPAQMEITYVAVDDETEHADADVDDEAEHADAGDETENDDIACRVLTADTVGADGGAQTSDTAANGSAQTADTDTDSDASQEETSVDEEPEDNTDWREDLAYLESEDYAPKRRAETEEVRSESAGGAEMTPLQDISETKAETMAEDTQKSTPDQGAESEKSAQQPEEKVQPEKSRPDPTKRKRHVRLARLLIAVVVILAAAGGISFLVNRYAPTSKKMEAAEYYTWMLARELNQEEVTLNASELVVVLQDGVSDKTAIYMNGRTYLNYDMVRENIFTRFYWDESLGCMLYTTADDTWQIPLNSAEYTTKDGTQGYDAVIFLSSGEEKYVCADFLSQYVNITCEAYPEESHVLVTYIWGERDTAEVTGNTAVRFGAGIKQLVLTTLRKGSSVYVLSESEDGTWRRVLTEDGYIGWVSAKKLTETVATQTENAFTEEEIPSTSLDGKVNLAWHQISNDDANKYLSSVTAGTSGLNVISPTWFALIDNDGNFSSYGSSSYVTKAHKKGLQVWGLVNNFSADMSTQTLTASYEARSALITNLINAALDLELDGINIDFETISEETGYSYVQFMRELSVATRANNLILSVDVPVPMSYNAHYDFAELGRYCDYVIMMGYDEHYSGSDAGSVASLSFEETGIRDLIAAGVPAAKVVSAIPFYTRLWYTTTSDDGTETTWSEVYGMDTIATTLDTYDVDPTWDETTGQNYAEWTLDDGTLCRIWIEDESSIALKAGLVHTYALGGIAEWALGFERDSIWPVITENIGA